MSVHNGARDLPAALDSILAQQGVDFEFIIIDDGSTDESGAILDDYAARDPRIRVVHQSNTGLTRALIRGCELARGEYIARQDADDWSHPERLADQLRLLESDARIGFVSCAVQYVGPHDEPLVVIRRPSDPAQATHGLLHQRQGPPAHGSVMFRRSLYAQVGGYRPEFHFAQDSDLWLRMAEQARIAYVDQVRYFHRRDAFSISGARRSVQRRFGEIGHRCRQARLEGRSETPYLHEAEQLAADLRQQGEAMPDPERGRSILAASYALGSQLARNHDGRARRYLWPVIKTRPWHWKAWVRLLQSFLPASPSNLSADRD